MERNWRSGRADRDQRLASLTAREREVLDLLLQDQTTKQISRVLRISSSTVEKHRSKILAKFNVNSVVGLAIYCLSPPQTAVPAPHWDSLFPPSAVSG